MNLNVQEATRQELTQALLHWRDLRESRLAQEKVAAKIKEQEQALKEQIIATMQYQLYDGVVAGGRTMGLSVKEVSIVVDAGALTKHIIDTGAIELLQLRLSAEAVREHQLAGEVIPGIGTMDKYDIYDRKV